MTGTNSKTTTNFRVRRTILSARWVTITPFIVDPFIFILCNVMVYVLTAGMNKCCLRSGAVIITANEWNAQHQPFPLLPDGSGILCSTSCRTKNRRKNLSSNHNYGRMSQVLGARDGNFWLDSVRIDPIWAFDLIPLNSNLGDFFAISFLLLGTV